MKRKRLAAATAVLVGLVAVRFAFPELGSGLRSGLRQAVERDLGFVEAFYDSAAHATDAPTPEDTAAPSPTAAPQYIYVAVTAAPSPTPTPEPTPTPLPEAVAAFLESQEAFAEYELPESVDYAYETLPFAYVVPVSGYNSSGFGYRIHPILNTLRFHYGTDFAAWSGENVLAFADGTVRYVGYDESYGWRIEIAHDGGWQTLYAHCSVVYAVEGQHVSGGDRIALVGATGLATGPHLHFELTRDGIYFNPEYYING